MGFSMERRKVKENISTLTAHTTRVDSGMTILQPVTEHLSIPMVPSTKENLSLERKLVKEL